MLTTDQAGNVRRPDGSIVRAASGIGSALENQRMAGYLLARANAGHADARAAYDAGCRLCRNLGHSWSLACWL